ncbi:hypothetical protein BDV12DRAFT_95467 [Aspergillus spectabilis]
MMGAVYTVADEQIAMGNPVRDLCCYRANMSASHVLSSRLEIWLISHLRNAVPAKYHDTLIPSYPVERKRVISDAGWLALFTASDSSCIDFR